MSERFAKVYESILDSTIWFEDDSTVRVWFTLMALAGPDGVVENTVPGLAHRALPRRPTVEAIEATELALERFQQPDKYSRTPDHEGRRIEIVEGGWRLLNHGKYRNRRQAEERKEQNRVAQAEKRARDRADASAAVSTCQHASAPVSTRQHLSAKSAQAEAEAEAEAEVEAERGARACGVSVVNLLAQLAGCWDGVDGMATSPNAMRTLTALESQICERAKASGKQPAEWFAAVVERFRADPQVRKKKLGLQVLLSQLDLWAETTEGAPCDPREDTPENWERHMRKQREEAKRDAERRANWKPPLLPGEPGGPT